MSVGLAKRAWFESHHIESVPGYRVFVSHVNTSYKITADKKWACPPYPYTPMSKERDVFSGGVPDVTFHRGACLYP